MLLFFPSEISLLFTTFVFPFLSRGNRELDFLSFQLIRSQEHRVGYCVSETKIGRTSVKSPSSHNELYLRAGKPCRIPHATTTWKIQEGPVILWSTGVYAYLPQVNQNCLWRMLRGVCRLHGEFSCPWKWKIWSCIASVAWTDTVTGQRQEQHFGQELHETWDERWEAVMQTAVAQLITGNVNKTALDCWTTLRQQEPSGYVNKILRVGSQHYTSLWQAL